MRQRHPYLRHDRVPGRPQKAFYLQVLLDPLEKQLDLPSPPVDRGDGGGRYIEIVRQELVCLPRFPVMEDHLPEGGRVLAAGDRAGEKHHFVRHDAGGPGRHGMPSDDLQARVALQPRDEEGVPRVDGGEPLQVAVPPVVHVYAVRHDAEVLPRGVDVGHFPVAHDDEAGDVPGQVQLRVQLDGALGGLVLRPRVHAEAHVNHRAVDRVQGVAKFEPVPRRKGRGAVKDLVEQRLEHFRRPPVHRVGQRGPGRLPHPEMVQAPGVHEQPLLDFPERILPRDLGVKACKELDPGGEALAVAVAVHLLDFFLKTMSRHEVEKL